MGVNYSNREGGISAYMEKINSCRVLPKNEVLSKFSQIQAARERTYELHVRDRVPLEKLASITPAHGLQQIEQLELLKSAASYELSSKASSGYESLKAKSLRDWYLGSYASRPHSDRSIDELLQATLLVNGSKNGIQEYVDMRRVVREDIYSSFYKLVVKVASWGRWPGEFSDKVQAGNRGMMAAVAGFDQSLGYSPSTYVFSNVKNYIQSLSEKKRGITGCNNPVFVDNMPFEDEPEYNLIDRLSDTQSVESIKAFMRKLAIEPALETLAPEDRKLIILHYYDGLGKNEIAEMLGVRVNIVQQKIGKALRVLRSSPTIKEAFSGSRQNL